MIRVWFAAAVLSAVVLPAAAADVPAELWDRPRSAQTVMAQPAVQQAVAASLAKAGVRIRVVHGPRQEAQLQAEELRAWLIALAVDGGRVQLQANPAVSGLRLELVE